MAEFKDRKYMIEVNGDIPYASPIQGGYEFVSNKRNMKFLVKKQIIQYLERNIQSSHFAVYCMIKETDSWIYANDSSVVRSITEFVKKIDVSPYFTKAIAEYKKQMNIE